MLKKRERFMLRGDAMTVAVGLAVALATFYLIQAIVGYLITPLISVFVGDTTFAFNSFRISSSEFRYGAVIEAAITFVFVTATAYYLLVVPYRRNQGRNDGAPPTRACPECTSSISAAAKRCPYCTAVVPLDPA